MKRNYMIIVFLTATLCCQAQVWAPAGATWHYDWVEFATDGYARIQYVKDSLVGGKMCKVLQVERHTYSWTTFTYSHAILGYEYTCLENDVVYYYRYGTFYKLYDFSSQAGDSWVVAGWDQGNPCDSLGSVIVDSTGITTINSFPLKYIHTSPVQDSDWGFYDKIVERIGSFGYMFPSPLCAVDIPGPGQLRCYFDDEFGLYQRTGFPVTCDYITGLDENPSKNNGIKTYPNPTSSTITVEMNNVPSGTYSLRISDLSGRAVKRMESNVIQIVIDVSDLREGIYFLTITNHHGFRWSQKIIKNMP